MILIHEETDRFAQCLILEIRDSAFPSMIQWMDLRLEERIGPAGRGGE